jgi:polyvinyl alcohol dehydrogenase (cytochrome)
MTYANGVVFQPTINGTVYALSAATGAILWSAQPGADLGGGIAVANGRAFVPYGYWFFASPANPNGGLVAYGPNH